MRERKLCFLSLSFLLGAAAAEYGLFLLWLALACFGLAWMRSAVRMQGSLAQKSMWIAAFFAAVALGSIRSFGRQAFYKAFETKLYDGKECLIQGKIYQKEAKEEKYYYYLKDCVTQLNQKNYSCNSILLSLNAGDYSIGEILCVKGTAQTFSLPVNEGNFNERAYYQSLGIGFLVEGEDVFGVYGKKNFIKEWLYGVRERVKMRYEEFLQGEDAGVLAAMTLGEKGMVLKERKTLYQDAGISHFYSISGLHISLLGMTLYSVLRKCGIGYFGSGLSASALILGYGSLLGFGVSKSRAIGMFLLLIYANLRGRSYDRPTALAVLAAVLVWGNAGFLQNAGFLLSFGAVTGVMLAEFLLERQRGGQTKEDSKNCRILGKVFANIKESVVVSVCIQVMTVPVLCQFFYGISPYAAIVNIIVIPCMGIMLGMALAGGLFCGVFPFVGNVAFWVCHMILRLFDGVCKMSLKLPYANLITGALSVWGILLWYGILFAILALKKSGRNKGLPVLACMLVVLLAAQKKPEFEIDILDVGQGDGIYIATGDGTDLFIDGGSSNVAKAGAYRILPFLKYRGIRQIDYWFVSHCDADHISGLAEIIEADYQIGSLVVSKFTKADAAFQTIRDLADKKGIAILTMDRNDTLIGKNKDWQMQCLWPKENGRLSDRNANSLALFFKSESLSGFFAGDIGEGQERELVLGGKLQKADLYKASHHGSKSSSGSGLLEALSPEITVISCSKNNRYGHPAKETIERLRAAGSRIFETSRMGQIKIKGAHLEPEGFSVVK